MLYPKQIAVLALQQAVRDFEDDKLISWEFFIEAAKIMADYTRHPSDPKKELTHN